MSIGLGRVGRWAREALLTVGAVVGLCCLLVTIGAALFGLRPLVFQSGSMSPTIDTGALALSHRVDASTLRVGQIVSVPTADGDRVTHRVVAVGPVGPVTQLELRGDANSVSDAATYRVTEADVVLFHVPFLGYLIGWLVGPIGLFLLGLYAAFLGSVLLKRAPRRVETDEADPAPARPRPAHRVTLTGASALVLVGATSGVMLQHDVTPTWASWVDGATVSGATLTAALPTVPLPAPTNVTCGRGSGRRAVLSWGTVVGATSYKVHTGLLADLTYISVTAPTTTQDLPNNTVGVTWVEADDWTSTSPPSAKFAYTSAGVCTPL